MIRDLAPIVVFVLGTILCICLLAFLTNSSISPYNNQVGPNDLSHWNSSHAMTAEGTFTFKSYNYFELRQGEEVKQSVYESPKTGEEVGRYWIRDFPISGTWETSADNTLYSTSPSTVTYTPSSLSMIGNSFVSLIVSCFAWLFVVGFAAKIS